MTHECDSSDAIILKSDPIIKFHLQDVHHNMVSVCLYWSVYAGMFLTYCSLIGWGWTRPHSAQPSLCCVDSCSHPSDGAQREANMRGFLASDWSRVILSPRHWPLIGREWWRDLDTRNHTDLIYWVHTQYLFILNEGCVTECSPWFMNQARSSVLQGNSMELDFIFWIKSN